MPAHKLRDQCYHDGCLSRECYRRIWTDDGAFDEVACMKHADNLLDHAARTIGASGRIETSRAMLQREPPPPVLHLPELTGCSRRSPNLRVAANRAQFLRSPHKCNTCLLWLERHGSEVRHER